MLPLFVQIVRNRSIAIAIGLLPGLCLPSIAHGDEVFVKIHQVDDRRIVVTWQSTGTGDGASRRGRGRSGSPAAPPAKQAILEIPADAMITAAMREQRTFEFRVGAELAGGLNNRVFRNFSEPLSARIVMEDGRITQLNVITEQSDINQSNADNQGNAVLAVRPQRPPTKK